MEFNSLDAQREACEAYVASQRAEGWVLVRDRYDDGGFSGGTLERPALQRLLADIEAGLVDVVVVYKIDRLSRSLMDFSRLVEVFDRPTSPSSPSPRLQHDDLDGTADAQHPALLRAVRARGHRRAHPRQVRGIAQEGHVDGRLRPARLPRQNRKLVIDGGEAATRPDDLRAVRRIGSATVLARDLRAEGITASRASWSTRAISTSCSTTGSTSARPCTRARLSRRARGNHRPGALGQGPQHPCREPAPAPPTPGTNAGPAAGVDLRADRRGDDAHPHQEGQRLYRYYVSQDVLKLGPEACPVRRLPAGEIEACRHRPDPRRASARPRSSSEPGRGSGRGRRHHRERTAASAQSSSMRCGTSCFRPSRRGSSSCWSSGSTSDEGAAIRLRTRRARCGLFGAAATGGQRHDELGDGILRGETITVHVPITFAKQVAEGGDDARCWRGRCGRG